jgi:hypothetical protein
VTTEILSPQARQLQLVYDRLPDGWLGVKAMSSLVRKIGGVADFDNAALGALVLSLQSVGLLQTRRSAGVEQLRKNPNPPKPGNPSEQLQAETDRRVAEERERRESELAASEAATAERMRPFREQEERHIREVAAPLLDELRGRVTVAEARVKRLERQLRRLGVEPDEEPALADS